VLKPAEAVSLFDSLEWSILLVGMRKTDVDAGIAADVDADANAAAGPPLREVVALWA
jgi:hypothetical protein